MLTIFASSILLKEFPVEKAIEILHDLGLNGVEIWAEHVWRYNSNPKDIVKAAKKYNMELSLHAPIENINIADENDNIRFVSIGKVQRSILLAERIGAVNVTVHPGWLTSSYNEKEWYLELLVESFRVIADIAEEANIIMSIELMDNKQNQLITGFEGMNKLLDRLSLNVTTTLNTSSLGLVEDFNNCLKKMRRVSKVHLGIINGLLNKKLQAKEISDLKCMMESLKKTDIPIVIEGHNGNEYPLELKNFLTFIDENFHNSICKV